MAPTGSVCAAGVGDAHVESEPSHQGKPEHGRHDRTSGNPAERQIDIRPSPAQHGQRQHDAEDAQRPAGNSRSYRMLSHLRSESASHYNLLAEDQQGDNGIYEKDATGASGRVVCPSS